MTALDKLIRAAIADYMESEGCSCCRIIDDHEAAKERLAKLLNVPKHADGSGYDFAQFRTNGKAPR